MSHDTTPAELRATTAPQSVASGATLMVLFKLIDRGVGFFSVMILARLLTPADFGLVAMAMSVVALIGLMQAFGFDTALIQRPNARREHFDTAWTFSVIFGASIATLLLVVALPAAHYYGDPRVARILPVLALGSLVGGFGNVGTVLFRKHLDFRREFRFLLTKRLLGFGVTVVLAVSLRNYWALVIGTLIGQSIDLATGYLLHPYRPRFSLAARGDLFGFSKWLFLSNVIQFLQGNADKFILGRTIGARSLGVYEVASEIAMMPSTALIAPINRAVYPAYAQLCDEPARLGDRFLRVMAHIAMIAFPTSIGLACLADPVVRLLLGPQWIDAIPLLRIFIVTGLASALQGNLYLLMLATGRPKINAAIQGGVLLFYLPALAWASVNHGALGAAWVSFCSGALALIPLHIAFFRLAQVSRRAYLGILWRPAIASCVMGAAILASQSGATATSAPHALALIAAGLVVGALSLVLALWCLWVVAGRPARSAEQEVWFGIGKVYGKARGWLGWGDTSLAGGDRVS